MARVKERLLTTCPVCQDTGFKVSFSKGTLNFVRCNSCGLVYINPQPTDNEINALYTEEYYRPWGLDSNSAIVAEMKISTFEDKLDKVENFAGKGRVLDIGCATGFFLEAAKRRGWDAFGVEISPYSSAIAQERFGKEKVFNGTLEAASYEDGLFDVVFMSDLIEHVKDLNGFLKEVFRILKKTGTVAIVTPDIESFSRKLMRSAWPHFKMEHLYYFSSSTIKRLLERHGFKLVHISSATKALNLSYVERQFSTYPASFITPLLKTASRLFPSALNNWKFKIRTGELFVIAEKVDKNA